MTEVQAVTFRRYNNEPHTFALRQLVAAALTLSSKTATTLLPLAISGLHII